MLRPPTRWLLSSAVKWLLPFVLLALFVVGCGSSGSGGGQDRETNALTCLRDKKGLPATLRGDVIQIGNPATGPRVRFFLTGGESEATQFEGRAEGTEQIGGTLLYVGAANDDTLSKVEWCLDNP